MDRLKEALNIWTGLGLLTGIFILPHALKAAGYVAGLGQQGWNPNWGYWRPLGNYGIGDMTHQGLNPLMLYSGSQRQLGVELNPLALYRGGANMGQAYRSGEDLLPFGIPGQYGVPIWKFAPTARDIM